MGVLVVIDGELKGQIFKVLDGKNRIGRNINQGDNEIDLPSKKVSKSHALLIHDGGTFVIKPLSDKNRTYINDTATDGDELADGDTIRLGATILKFRTI